MGSFHSLHSFPREFGVQARGASAGDGHVGRDAPLTLGLRESMVEIYVLLHLSGTQSAQPVLLSTSKKKSDGVITFFWVPLF